MSRSESESEFDRMMLANQQNLLASGGATSPYRPIEAEVGEYYARIVLGQRDVVNAKVKDAQGNDTGKTVRAPRVQLKFVITCSADPKCPPEHREMYSGVQGFFSYTLTPGDQEAWNRLAADLETIGIRTKNIRPSEQYIRVPGVELTMEQALTIITNHKPWCLMAVSAGKTGGKFVNYRDAASQQDVERMMGHAINEAIFVPQPEAAPTYLTPEVGQAPPAIPGQPGGYPGGLPANAGPAIPVGPGAFVAPPVMPTIVPPGMPVPVAVAPPAMPAPVAGPPVYPQAGAKFAGDPANLEWQTHDNLWFDKHSKHYYDREGNYVNPTPALPQPPPAPAVPAASAMPMMPGVPQSTVPQPSIPVPPWIAPGAGQYPPPPVQ